MDTRIIRSKRKTLALEVRDGLLTVRAPHRVSDRQIQAFIQKNQAWIEKAAARQAQRQAALDAVPKLTAAELETLAAQARAYFPRRADHYAGMLGVDYGAITIRRQRSRWGSCSAKGNLSFNCLLMLTPPEVIDSVVAHEICHRKEMNHSPRFYAHLRRIFPDYDAARKWLAAHGQALLARLPEG